VGVNTETKYVIIWKDENECEIENFPTEIVKRILKIDETRAFLLLEATSSSQ
jgi:hypothetical protein